MLRLLLTRRWLSLIAVLVVIVPTFVALGFWQLDRYDQRRASNAAIERNAGADPVPLESLLGVGEPVRSAIEWRPVTASGRYDNEYTLLVRNRTAGANGAPGFHVLTPLVTQDGTAILVNRGWIPYGESAVTSVTPPTPPGGEVTVVGRLRPTERGSAAGLPAGQIAKIDTAAIGADLPYDTYAGYVELVSEEPTAEPAPTLLDVPNRGVGPHLAYAVQWFLFAAIAIGGFGYLLRREAGEGQEQEQRPLLIPSQGARTR